MIKYGKTSLYRDVFKKLNAIVINKKIGMLYIILITLAPLVVLLLSPSGYLIASPGPVFTIKSDYQELDRVNGEYGITTVEYKEASRAKVVIATLKNKKVVPNSLNFTNKSLDEMDNSKKTAFAVAYSLLQKKDPGVVLEIVDVQDGSFAHRNNVSIGDSIVEIDGKQTDSTSLSAIQSNKVLRVKTISTNGMVNELTLPKKGKIGVILREKVNGYYPTEGLKTENIGGASAGLLFTLYVLDLHTKGDLSNGLRVSGTGSIKLNGDIGEVNGADLKYKAARKIGYDVFFTSNEEIKGDKVVHVHNIKDVLTELCKRGSVPACTYTAK